MDEEPRAVMKRLADGQRLLEQRQEALSAVLLAALAESDLDLRTVGVRAFALIEEAAALEDRAVMEAAITEILHAAEELQQRPGSGGTGPTASA